MRYVRRTIMLYFRPEEAHIAKRIMRYARRRNISFTRAIWTLVARGLEKVDRKEISE